MYSVDIEWMIYVYNRFEGYSPFKAAVRRGQLLRTSDDCERNIKVRAITEARVWAGISETRYPFR